MGKIIEIRNLYKDTLKDITTTEEKWMSFLDSSSWNFKYSFEDQVLIYAQRPDAKACAEMEVWNKKVHRWVNKNASYIFVNSQNNSKYPYRLVFDVSDTHNYKNEDYKLWEAKPQYENEIIEDLENAFGEITSKESLAQAITLCAYNIVSDNIQDYLISVNHFKEGTTLENYTDEDIRNILLPTVWASVSYMMMKRCGIDARQEINIEEFSFINNFSDENLLTILGAATSDIAEMGLREIAKTVINLENVEKKKNRTFVNKNNLNYPNNVNDLENGGNENERNNIYETRRISDSKYQSGGGDTSNREIRKDEIELSKESQESRVHNLLERPETSRAFDRSSGTSNAESSRDNSSNGEEIEHNRGIEENRPNGMDKTNEQLEESSRGDSNERTDIYLEPTVQEQLDIINEAEVENTPAFNFSQEKIDEVLVSGSGFEDGKFRIYRQFKESLSSKDNSLFLKNEYGIGGRSWENGGWINYDSKGISLETDDDKLLLSWNKVEKRISELVKVDRYLNSKEKEEYPKWLDTQENKEILIQKAKQIENANKEYEYHLGDTVYIGADEYEIASIGQTIIQLYDPRYPLFR